MDVNVTTVNTQCINHVFSTQVSNMSSVILADHHPKCHSFIQIKITNWRKGGVAEAYSKSKVT